jgi:hypothetical protein
MRQAAFSATPTGLTLINGPEPAALSRSLLWLTTFGRRERDLIREDQHLLRDMRAAHPSEWAAILQRHRDEEAARMAERCRDWQDDAEGMRRQALHDLSVAAQEFASLTDGRRTRLYSLVCRLARYARQGILTEAEVTATMIDAAKANGSLTAHGVGWARGVIRRGLEAGQNDPLPPLARAFRSERSGA